MCTVVIRNDLAEIARLQAEILEFADRRGLSQGDRSRLQLVLEELVTNVISHAYSDAGEHEIMVRLSVVDGSIRAEIEDDGIPFDASTEPAADVTLPLKERPIGGLGLVLVQRFADHVRYQRSGDRNHLAVTVRPNSERS